MSIPLPHWLDRVPAAERRAAQRRFLLRAAVLYAGETGHATDLATALGMTNRKSLGSYVAKGTHKKITDAMAADIERLTGGAVRADLLRS